MTPDRYTLVQALDTFEQWATRDDFAGAVEEIMGAGAKDEIVSDSWGDRGRYLSAKEAADLLGVNRATVINWARQGKFGGFQYGQRGIYRFDRQEIMEFINRSRIPMPVEAGSGREAPQ